MGARATLDPRPGGRFGWDTMEGFLVEGDLSGGRAYRVASSSHGDGKAFRTSTATPSQRGRARWRWSWCPRVTPPIVKLTHRVPAQLADFHALGWEHYLGRLAEAAAGRDPGPDPMLDIAASMMAGD